MARNKGKGTSNGKNDSGSSKPPTTPKAATVKAPARSTQDNALLRELTKTLAELKSMVRDSLNEAVRPSQLDALANKLEMKLGDTAVERSSAELDRRWAQFAPELEELKQLRALQRQEIERLLRGVESRIDRVDESLGEIAAVSSPSSIHDSVVRIAKQHSSATIEQEITPKIQRLEAFYDDADDKLEDLKTFVSSFGPGGLPVVAQERDALRQRVQDLESQVARREDEAQTLRNIVSDLESSQLRRVLEHGVDPELLEGRLNELSASTRDLADRQSLQSENQRLHARIDALTAEIERWSSEEKAVQQGRADHARMERLEDSAAEADQALKRSQNMQTRLESQLRNSEAERKRLSAHLKEVEQAERTAEEREERLSELTDEVTTLAAQLESSQAEQSAMRADLARRSQDIEALLTKLEAAEDRLGTAEAEWRRAYAEEILEEKAEAMTRFRQAAQDESEARHNELVQELGRLRPLQDQNRELRDELSEAHMAQQKAKAELTLQLELNAQYRQDCDADFLARQARQEEDLTQRAAQMEQAAAAEAEALLRGAQQEVEDLEAKQEQLALAINDLVNEDEEIRNTIADLSGQKGVLTAELEVLRARVAELRTKDVDEAERLGKLREPCFAAEDLCEIEKADETQWLQRIATGIKDAGFHFHPRLLRAFHTSLKIADMAPLAVLAGISGTGKSELPRLYADLGGLPFLELAVQPSWDDPQNLFGFFNYTDGRLKAEPLARLLHQMQDPEDPLRQGPVIVLLDEMNLARVEYYFADLLSKLEARRGVRDNDVAARERACIRLDAGPGARDELLYPDPRVLFVGTMNEDESTLTLSDKVLDRACLLTFPAPKEMRMAAQGERSRATRRLSWESWRAWQTSPHAEHAKLQKDLNAVNEPMAELGRPFGHRLFRAIHGYLANYPQAKGEDTHEDAWADQFAMKILPRLRGLECDDKRVRDGLDQLSALVPPALQGSFDRAREGEFFTFAGAPELYRAEQ